MIRTTSQKSTAGEPARSLKLSEEENNYDILKEEMLKAFSDRADEHRVNMLNQSIMKYRVSGLQGSPYLSKLT